MPSRRDWLTRSSLLLAGWSILGPSDAQCALWTEQRRFGPFTCHAEFPLDRLIQFFGELRRLEQEIQRTLATLPVRDHIDIYLLADQAAHRNFLSSAFPRVPYRRALYVQRAGRGAVYAYQHDELEIDLRHECTHAMLHANVGTMPLWLDEGLAEYFEMPEEDRSFAHPHLAAIRWYGRLGLWRSIESLEGRQELAQMGPLEYRFSWAWVHFMLHGHVAAHRTLVRFLAEARDGAVQEPLSSRIRAALPDVDALMARHFQHWNRAGTVAGAAARQTV